MPKVRAGIRSYARPQYANALLSLLQDPAVQSGHEALAYAHITQVAHHVLAVDHASIWVWKAKHDSVLTCLSAYVAGQQIEIADIDSNDMPMYFAQLWHEISLVCEDATQCRGDNEISWEEWQGRIDSSTRSAMHIRLMGDEVMLGLLRLEFHQPHHWTQEQKTFAMLLSEQVVHVLQHEDRARLQQELQLISKVFEVSRDAIVVMSEQGIVQQVNPAFSSITGFSPEEIVGHHYPSWVNEGGQVDVDFGHICHLVRAGSHWQGELLQRRKHTPAQVVWQTMLSVTDNNGLMTNFIAIETDLSGYKEAQARVHYLSHYDTLTGMANRQELQEQLSHMIDIAHSSNHHVAVLCVDIDDFKKVNLSMGHTLGDQLLNIIATRLNRANANVTHGLWARLSADEFVFAGAVEQITEAESMMTNIQHRLHDPFAIGGQHVRLTASLGTSLYPQDAHDSESLLRAAQTAMRAVKQLGGNGQRFYTSTMNEQAVERLLLENQLARAVNGGQLVLHYQPQVSLTDGHLVGLEALVRWQHPELGLVSPGVFIPLAEETGLIEEIGDWVLEEACRQLAEWREAHLPVVMMAVNISAPQFTRQPICQRVSELLAKYQLPSSLLELELTERVVMHDPAHVREVMNNLAALGVQLSMDDFGTGYSSLSYLQKFPLDKLKIDMSFVRNIASSKDDLAIAKAIIQLGHSLDLTVIAEGVETIEQKHLLKQAGCQEGQGYYFAKPLPAEKVAELLKQPLVMSKGVFG